MPPAATRSVWRPCSATPLSSTTTIRSACWIVASRCAITSGRPALGQLEQRLLDHPLGLGVERGGRLIEDQDRRVLEEHAGDREPLLLPAGELDAALADDRVQPIRQAGDHIVQSGPARRVDDLRLGCVEPAVGDVLADRAGEEEDILLDDADLAPQRRQRHVADVDPVDRDPARIDFVEARQQ